MCQITNTVCDINPTDIRPRHYHTAIVYNTYNKSQADNMCKGSKCGPLCDTQSPSCDVSLLGVFPIGGTPNNNNPVPGNDSCLTSTYHNCPPLCCNATNEICQRLYDNTGNRVGVDDEMMLVFGGITFLETVINGTNINDNCESRPIHLK